MPKHYSSSYGVFGVLQDIKLAENIPKYQIISPNLYYQAIVYLGVIKTFPMAI
jgi:hypothetical protein